MIFGKKNFLQQAIRDKLVSTNNYIAEIVQLKAAIPYAWKTLRAADMQQSAVLTNSSDLFIHTKDQSVELK